MVGLERFGFIVSFAAASMAKASTTCPSYNDIRDSSVDASNFSVQEFSGMWYMVATSEPTLPAFCVCSVYYVNVDVQEGIFNYTNIVYCDHLNRNISIRIKGVLSSDASSPGLLHENAELFNHTLGKLDPNMIFRVNRGADGAIRELFAYACLGKLPPIMGKEAFSFNILSRKNNYDDSELNKLVLQANSTSSGKLKLSGIRFNNASTYRDCKMRVVGVAN